MLMAWCERSKHALPGKGICFIKRDPQHIEPMQIFVCVDFVINVVWTIILIGQLRDANQLPDCLTVVADFVMPRMGVVAPKSRPKSLD